MDVRNKNWRDATITTSSGKSVHDTKQLSGEGKDALHGKNEMKQYETSAKVGGPFGGKPSGK